MPAPSCRGNHQLGATWPPPRRAPRAPPGTPPSQAPGPSHQRSPGLQTGKRRGTADGTGDRQDPRGGARPFEQKTGMREEAKLGEAAGRGLQRRILQKRTPVPHSSTAEIGTGRIRSIPCKEQRADCRGSMAGPGRIGAGPKGWTMPRAECSSLGLRTPQPICSYIIPVHSGTWSAQVLGWGLELEEKGRALHHCQLRSLTPAPHPSRDFQT